MKVAYPAGREPRASFLGNYRWVPWAIVACFAVVFAVNGGLVYYALSSWPGLTVDHAYSDGLAYNTVIDEAAKEAKLGWSLAIDFVSDRKTDHNGRLVVQAKDKSGAALDGLQIRAEIVRPVGDIPQIPLALTADAEGHYAAPVTLPRPGQWVVYVTAQREGAVYRTGRRIVVP